MTGAPLLSIDGLGVRFQIAGPLLARLAGLQSRFIDAVLDVSLAVAAGRTLALVGESGSGKTTLARAALGLARSHAGRVRFDGVELAAGARHAPALFRREAAFMFQDPVASLSPRMNVQSLISEPFIIHRIRDADPRREAARLLDLVGLPAGFAGRYPHELSGGQARRVGVARALALSPKLVVADEPTAGLDVSVQGEVINLLGDLQRDLGLTYLIISHNLALVRHIADEIAIMYLGRIVERGPTAAIYARPAHPYTAALLAAQPDPDPTRRRAEFVLEGEVPSLARRPQGCEFRTRCPFAQPRCAAEAPTLHDHGGGREIRCHFPLDRPAPLAGEGPMTGLTPR